MFIAGFPVGSLAANCYLVAPAAGAGCVIIDPGEDALAQIVATAAEHRLVPQAALLTHGHLDHAGSLQLVARHFGIPGYLHSADEYMLDDPLAALSAPFRAMLAGRTMPAMRPDELRRLVPGNVVACADLSFSVDHTPGHTGGSVIMRLAGDGPRPDVLFTGDTLFAGSVGRTDLPGGSAAELNESLRRSVLSQSDDAVVLPGHGPQTTIGAERRANPFLVPLISADPGAYLSGS